MVYGELVLLECLFDLRIVVQAGDIRIFVRMTEQATSVGDATWKDRIMFFLGRRTAFRVEGNSMNPTLSNGDVVLIESGVPVIPGDIVLANHPYKQSVKMLKRIEAIDGNERYTLIGDSPDESTDSRTFGTIAGKEIIGKVVGRLRRG